MFASAKIHVAFAQLLRARHPLDPGYRAVWRRCGLRFMLWTAHLVHPASTQASRPTPGASLPGALAAPRTGLPPAGHHELVLGDRRKGVSFLTAS
jgi:hypothetical protein